MKHHAPIRASQPHPLIMVHRLLRGRYIAGAVLGCILAAALAAAGYKVASPSFSSTGMLRVAPVLPKILYGNEENQQMPQFDSYLVAQMQLVTSRPVLELAVADPGMRKIGWAEGAAGVADLGRRLTVVKGGPRSELIEISVADERPLIATQAVNSVLDAFVAYSAQGREQASSVREATLQDRLQELREQLVDVERRLLVSAGEFGPDNLERVHSSKVSDIERLDSKIVDLENNIAEQEAKKTSQVASEESDAEVKRLTIADHAMANLLIRRADRQSELDNLKLIYGPDHPRFVAAKISLQAIESAIQSRIEQLATLGKTGVLTAQKSSAADEQPVELLRQLRLNLISMRSKSAEESIKLGERRFEVDSLRSRRVELMNSMDDTQRRLDQTRVESRALQPGRVSVAVRGMVPVAPSKDRRKASAAGGAAAGALLGFVLCILDRVIRPRILRADEIDSILPQASLLGLVPDARDRRVNDKAIRHQIALLRSSLETLREPNPGPEVILVTSAAEGEGKTNVALALSRSFASSGRRTLLIDGDVNRLGLTNLLSLQHAQGLLDVLSAREGGDDSLVMDRGNLWVLPAGIGCGEASDAISMSKLSEILSSYRERFDTIVIDSEHCVNSPTARLLNSVAHRALLVVRRGQRRSRLSAAVMELSRLNTASIHVVLNCAARADCDASHFARVESRNTTFALAPAVT